MVDQLLGGLFGSQDDDDEPTRWGRARDFVDRYEQRGAYDQIGDDEVFHNYRAATSRLSPDEYHQAAADAMRPDEPRAAAGAEASFPRSLRCLGRLARGARPRYAAH